MCPSRFANSALLCRGSHFPLRPSQIRRADVTMPDRDRDFEATGGGKSCPAEVAVASPVAAVRSESDSGCPPPLPSPLWALLRTHSLARRAHFTVTPSLPAGSLALARSLVALPFLTEFRALSPSLFSPPIFSPSPPRNSHFESICREGPSFLSPSVPVAGVASSDDQRRRGKGYVTYSGPSLLSFNGAALSAVHFRMAEAAASVHMSESLS